MPSPICVVYGCKSGKGITKHRFPKNDLERFVIWVERACNSKLINLTIDQIYNSYLMCDLHFDENCHSPGTKLLNRNALPTLFLPEIILVQFINKPGPDFTDLNVVQPFNDSALIIVYDLGSSRQVSVTVLLRNSFLLILVEYNLLLILHQ
ncbi:Zinc finger, C2CH-type [Cinara cedri]|uniref:Zinc finger, C2CH-type n=1 Tax=Cinara cedri TaxID=506608 RepID=A0A5E4MTW9_9HEMI|nr:Zinc finger, C2CH-type [Cinara cedri]